MSWVAVGTAARARAVMAGGVGMGDAEPRPSNAAHTGQKKVRESITELETAEGQ